MDRLLTAYQEDLLSLDELRRRMPELRKREQALHTEMQSILDQTNDRAVYLRLAETLSSFLDRLRTTADNLDIEGRQRIVRLVIREILVGDETIIIRHSIPLSTGPTTGNDGQPTPSGPSAPGDRSYLLRSGRHLAVALEYRSQRDRGALRTVGLSSIENPEPPPERWGGGGSKSAQ